jgi:hypothetical protein
MNSEVREFFRIGKGHFQAVRFLSQEENFTWEEAKELDLPRSWYELTRVCLEDRLDFVRDSWVRKFSFHLQATTAIEDFFDRLDDIVILISRRSVEDPWEAEMIYSFADQSTFFRGLVPSNEETIDYVKDRLKVDLPKDYWAFNRLHDGFGRLSEIGMIPILELEDSWKGLIRSVKNTGGPLQMGTEWIDPSSLYPFFEDYGIGSFQCFNASWYPGTEMGNVHFSGIDYTLSDTQDRKEWSENLAFPTFLEWLAAFLQGMSSCI